MYRYLSRRIQFYSTATSSPVSAAKKKTKFPWVSATLGTTLTLGTAAGGLLHHRPELQQTLNRDYQIPLPVLSFLAQTFAQLESAFGQALDYGRSVWSETTSQIPHRPPQRKSKVADSTETSLTSVEFLEKLQKFESLDDVLVYLTTGLDRMRQLADRLPDTEAQVNVQKLCRHMDQHVYLIHQLFARYGSENTKKVHALAKLEEQVEELLKQANVTIQEGQVDAGLLDKFQLDWVQGENILRGQLIDQLMNDHDQQMNQQSAQLTETFIEQLISERESLHRQFQRDVQHAVDTERQGRLAKLDQLIHHVHQLDQRVHALTERARNTYHTQDYWSAFHALQSRLNQEQPHLPFHEEWQTFRHAAQKAGDTFLLTLLDSIPADTAQQGLSTLHDLQTTFPSVRAHIEKAGMTPDDARMEGYFLSSLFSRFLVRRHGYVDGKDVMSVLARVEVLVGEGELDGAVRELKRLPVWCHVVAKRWMEEAQTYAEVEMALKAVHAHLGTRTLEIY